MALNHIIGLRGVLCGAVASCVAIVAGCRPEDEPEASVVRPVKTMVVAGGEGLRLRTFPGTVQASRRVELAFRVPGLLANLPVTEGQRVAKGDLIAQLRQDEFEARLKSLQGELDQGRAGLRALVAGERPEEVRRREAALRAARARLASARADFERIKSLFDSNAVSRQEFDRSEANYLVAQEEYTAAQETADQATTGREEDIDAMEAQIRGTEGRLAEAQIQLEDSTLRAPYDGVIAQRFVEQGQNITVNQRVVQFQDVEEVDIAVDVPEVVMAGEIQRSEIVSLAAELSAAPGIEFPVRIREIAQVADPVTQTFNVRVAMKSPENFRVLPGMTGTVSITYRRASVLGERILVPVEAIAKLADGSQVVWVLGGDGNVSPRPVQLGDAEGGRVEVMQGLQAGDRIVVAGVRFLRAGMPVRDLGDALGVRP